MAYPDFLALIQQPSPAFVCYPAGRFRRTERFTARITHEVRPPALPADLALLRQLIPAGADELLAFYARHDGFVLYRDTLSETAGVELFRVRDMERQTGCLRTWLERLDDGSDINRLKTAIAIGESPHSGNYFAMTVKGRQTGKVFFVDHDDWREEPIANSFDEFLTLVSTSPVTLLSKTLNCIARYSDGHTDSQWIPMEFIPDLPS